MSWRGEVEDGTGWGGLVESKAEREARKAHRAEMLKHYASGLEDGRADVLAKFAALLPSPHYMGPPDGGDVSVLEQMRRMSEDAARWRWFMDGLGDQGPKLATSVDMAIQEDKAAAPSEEVWTARFAPRDSCRGCHPGHCGYPECVKPGAGAAG